MVKFMLGSGLPDNLLLLSFGFIRSDVIPADGRNSRRFFMPPEEIAQKLEQGVRTRSFRKRDFSLQELSEKVSIPERYLRLYFKNELNTCFRQWRMDVRMEEACEKMLSEPDRTVLSIAHELGFDDLSNFHRQFRRATGCTPNQWRKSRSS